MAEGSMPDMNLILLDECNIIMKSEVNKNIVLYNSNYAFRAKLLFLRLVIAHIVPRFIVSCLHF